MGKNPDQSPLEVNVMLVRAKGEGGWWQQSVCLCGRLGAGRKEMTRTLLTMWRDSACCNRESHRRRQNFMGAALLLTPKRFMNTCPRKELCQSS